MMAEGSVLKNIALLAAIGFGAKIIVMNSVGSGHAGVGFWIIFIISVLVYSACDLLAWIKVEFDIQKLVDRVCGITKVIDKTVKPKQ